MAGAGELHLEICLKDLQEDFMKGAPLKISDPVVSFSGMSSVYNVAHNHLVTNILDVAKIPNIFVLKSPTLCLDK